MAKASDHPFSHRVSHWINLVNFSVLIVTGFLIHAPFQGIQMNMARSLHFFFMYVLMINGLVRLYLGFFGKNKDYTEFFFSQLDVKTLIPQIKFYLFLGPHPKTNKYNPLQKLAYLALPLFTIFQAFTGLILYFPVRFQGLADSLGGLAAVRGIHYVTMWVFILIICVHIYLAFTEAYDQVGLMFFGKTDNNEGKTIGEVANKSI
ncbi:MAG: Quinone-reactive Ni/Fe-hydrogenase B-type cytochrome subunit [Candidatus Dichloromethanomonas elyunquensis]|nr:MAG: Quinone-reactive Ni/Fe-hydrogenase B-type cytochrome subunit [Candidatus Dichloromethanomonas elyunquensis]